MSGKNQIIVIVLIACISYLSFCFGKDLAEKDCWKQCSAEARRLIQEGRDEMADKLKKKGLY